MHIHTCMYSCRIRIISLTPTVYIHIHIYIYAGSGEVNRAYYKADVAGALYEVLVQFGASALICEKAFQVSICVYYNVYTSVYSISVYKSILY